MEALKWLTIDDATQIVSPTWSDQTIWVNQESGLGLTGVPKSVWEFEIGGYKVCEKWMKNRKGRIFTSQDMAQYELLVGAIFTTIKLMEEIDLVIKNYGVWQEKA